MCRVRGPREEDGWEPTGGTTCVVTSALKVARFGGDSWESPAVEKVVRLDHSRATSSERGLMLGGITWPKLVPISS